MKMSRELVTVIKILVKDKSNTIIISPRKFRLNEPGHFPAVFPRATAPLIKIAERGGSWTVREDQLQGAILHFFPVDIFRRDAVVLCEKHTSIRYEAVKQSGYVCVI
jgi:hypothetical protein